MIFHQIFLCTLLMQLDRHLQLRRVLLRMVFRDISLLVTTRIDGHRNYFNAVFQFYGFLRCPINVNADEFDQFYTNRVAATDYAGQITAFGIVELSQVSVRSSVVTIL